jgi:5-methylcytosine-specific restriction endonuclease McrA
MPSYHCNNPTCPVYLPHHGYCPAHAPQERADQRETDRQYDKQRDPKSVAFYKSVEWQATRLNKLQADPFCQFCERQAATEVHHKQALRSNWDLRLVHSNLMSTCGPCHKRYEARMRGKSTRATR